MSLGMQVLQFCTKFHGYPDNGCWDISLKNTIISLMVALTEKSEVHQS